jgi:type II secretory pathway pseudopilin PulG
MTDRPGVAAPQRDWIEIAAAVLLALAAVATAWSSYQATRWNGEQSKAASRANALRAEATQAATRADSQTEIDVATFIQWVDARAKGDQELASFYVERFRPEFRPAFDAWLATDPLSSPDAPPTPFAMDEYRLEAATEADRLDAEAEGFSAAVRRDVQRAGNYVLGVVLFAVALFFAGMSTRLGGRGVRIAMLAVGCLVFAGAVAWIATFPVIVSV